MGGAARRFVTGGDAQRMAAWLGPEWTRVEHLVLEGLAPPPNSTVVRQVSSLPAIRAGTHVDLEAIALIRLLTEAEEPRNGPRVLGFEWALRSGLTVITQPGRVTFGGAERAGGGGGGERRGPDGTRQRGGGGGGQAAEEEAEQRSGDGHRRSPHESAPVSSSSRWRRWALTNRSTKGSAGLARSSDGRPCCTIAPSRIRTTESPK